MKFADISGENTEGDVAAPKDVTALLTPPLEDNMAHPSNGRLAPQSPTQTPPSSPPSDPPPLSDRHGYRFRCSRCSLAFPTQEKLQLHWQYHAMRAATECPLCSRQCRSQEALQRHMQNTHAQLDNTLVQNAIFAPHSEQYIENNKGSVQQDLSLSPQEGQEAGEGEDDAIEEEVHSMEEQEEIQVKIQEKSTVREISRGEVDLTEAEKVQHEEILSESSSNTLFRKSSNPTMDRYLDPSRPYKCTICSESFTQKTILLVHYNSVSHLHRARRALQDSNTGVSAPEPPRGPDPRPYRCKLCGVGYSQSSTLDIHLRSVLHQTRARAAQNSGPQTPVSNVVSPVSAQTTATQAVTTSEEPAKTFPLTKKPDVVSSSTSSLPGVAAEAQPPYSSQTDDQQAKKRVAELIASRNQLMLIQQQQLAQAQAQAQLQHTALLQSQVMQHLPLGPESLFQHFSLAPDNLLSLQQQLLMPFYFSGDMKLNPDLATKTIELSQTEPAKSTPREQVKIHAKGESLTQADEKQIQRQCPQSAVIQPKDHVQFDAKADTSCVDQPEREYTRSYEEEKDEMAPSVVRDEAPTEDTDSSPTNPGLQCPPPRVPFATVNGESLRALLQSYGYELALQYIQSRHRHQQQMATQMTQEIKDKMEVYSEEERVEVRALQDGNVDNKRVQDGNDMESFSNEKDSEHEELTNKKKACCEKGEKCQDCGKFFSDAMILKSHQEYIHRLLFPSAALERFSKEYRLQYDLLYPLTQPKDGENSTIVPETEPKPEMINPPVESIASSPESTVSDPTSKTHPAASDGKSSAPEPSPLSPSQHQLLIPQEKTVPNVSATPTPQNTSPVKAMPLPIPKIPMLPLPIPQLPIPPLSLPKLPLPSIPFPMELPLLPSVVMQSVALSPQSWLDSSVNPELAKLYQSQLSPALLGQQPQISPAMLAQQPQLSPALIGQSPLNSALLGQPPQPNLIQTGQQPQVSPTILEPQQGKRTRTRISEDQLTVLRKHFDINSLPSDEEMNKMSALAGLPHKVIKHWFRNTLFKERQRDKDSPYNFNNPPTTALDESREEASPDQSFTVSPSSLSPGLPASTSQQSQTADLHRGEPQRGRRSSRTRFTEKQLETLQGVFEATPYPREEEYDRLSALLSLPNRVIVVWFQNARQRARKSQDRGTDDGLEGKNLPDNIQRQSNGCDKNDDVNEHNRCADGQSDSHNENSMDLTYEYYTHPDSPLLDSSTHCSESDPLLAKGDTSVTPVAKKHENKTAAPQANKSAAIVEIHPGNGDTDIQSEEMVKGMQTVSSQARVQIQLQPERPQPCSSSTSQDTLPVITSMSDTNPGKKNSLHSDPSIEKLVDSTLSTASAPESKASYIQQPEASSGLSKELQPQNPLQAHKETQFQCSLCPVSLPSFQLWQEHQTRHLLAAQSQVQLLHSGFTDRTMPYMMLHPNHPLMASQMLSSTMSQIHPSATHPMISHLGLPIKSTLSDHSSTSGLTPNSMTPTKQSSKLLSEISFEGQRCGRDAEEEHRRDKRQRTTITPEQLEILYQRYSLDSNPTRGVLEGIARDVGLTRRVVQVLY